MSTVFMPPSIADNVDRLGWSPHLLVSLDQKVIEIFNADQTKPADRARRPATARGRTDDYLAPQANDMPMSPGFPSGQSTIWNFIRYPLGCRYCFQNSYSSLGNPASVLSQP